MSEKREAPLVLEEGMVAHRIVMRSEVWSMVEALAEEMTTRRGIEVAPGEVAAMVLELSLTGVALDPDVVRTP